MLAKLRNPLPRNPKRARNLFVRMRNKRSPAYPGWHRLGFRGEWPSCWKRSLIAPVTVSYLRHRGIVRLRLETTLRATGSPSTSFPPVQNRPFPALRTLWRHWQLRRRPNQRVGVIRGDEGSVGVRMLFLSSCCSHLPWTRPGWWIHFVIFIRCRPSPMLLTCMMSPSWALSRFPTMSFVDSISISSCSFHYYTGIINGWHQWHRRHDRKVHGTTRLVLMRNAPLSIQNATVEIYKIPAQCLFVLKLLTNISNDCIRSLCLLSSL